MPLAAKDLWVKIQKEMKIRSSPEQIAILHRHLNDWPDEWRGPYWELKQRLLKILSRLERTESVRSARGRQDPFHIRRQGHGQVCFVGLTNSGKSALVYTLTHAPTDVTDYPFATQLPIVGMLDHKHASLQIVDTPLIVENISKGEGVGRQLLHLIQTTDALGIVIDLSSEPQKQMAVILDELRTVDIQAIPQPLGTIFGPKGKGGIKFRGRLISKEERSAAHQVLAEHHISHAESTIRTEFSQHELAAQIERKHLIPTVLIANKNDVDGAAERQSALQHAFADYIVIDVNFLNETHFDKLKDTFVEMVGLICVSVLEKPTPSSQRTPLCVPRSATIGEIMGEFVPKKRDNMVSAKVWGTSVKRSGQAVSMDHLVEDGDLIYCSVK